MTDQPNARNAALGSAHGQTVETWDDYVFDVQAETVFLGGHFIPTTAKEFTLALLLFRNLSKAVSRDVIMRAVWGYDSSKPDRALDSHISQLRVRLGLNPKHGYLLAAVYNFGFRLERLNVWKQTSPRGVK